MIAVSLVDSLREDRAAVYGRPVGTALLAALMAAMAAGHLVKADSFFVSDKVVGLFLLVRETSELLALMVTLYVAYRWHPALGTGAMLLFLTMLAPFYFANFTSHFTELVRLLFVVLMSLFGIRLIAELRRAVQLMRQREREIGALAGLHAVVLNERVQFLEESNRKGERLSKLQKAVCVAAQAKTPQEVARQLLPSFQEEVGATYASLTLVTPGGALGERVDSFVGMQPFVVGSHHGGLAEAVLMTGETQYIADARIDPRANPSLSAAGIRSYVGLALRTPERLAGILFLHSTRPKAFLEDKEFMESIANLFGGCLYRAQVLTPVPVAAER